MLLALLLLAAPSSQPDDSLITKTLRTCGHSEGPLALRVTQGKESREALAFTCSSKGKTTLYVHQLLPSGLYAPFCDVQGVVGIATQLTLASPRPILYVVTRAHTPEEERVIESAIQPQWGACKTLAASDVRHPADEDAVLREPRAGVRIDERGVFVWSEIVRFQFTLSVSERRKVAMAMRGKLVAFDPAAPPSEEEERDAFDPIPLAGATMAGAKGAQALAVLEGQLQSQPVVAGGQVLELGFARAPVRGVRLRMHDTSGPMRVEVAGVSVAFSPVMAWSKAPGVFGAGLLKRGDVRHAEDAVVFFQPPLDAEKITLKASGETSVALLEIIPFVDAQEWDLFEPSEDFGEAPSGR